MAHDLALKLIDLFQSLDTFHAYALIIGVLWACGFGVPIPEDVTLISAGIISASKTISLQGALLAGFIGVIGGDGLLFMLGHWHGRKVYAWPIFNRIFTPDLIAKAEARVRKNARVICFAARFMPGLRAPIFLTAGSLGVKPAVFLLMDGLAASISVPIWIVLGHWFGSNIDLVLKTAKKINAGIFIVLVVLVIAFLAYRHFRKPSPPQQTQ